MVTLRARLSTNVADATFPAPPPGSLVNEIQSQMAQACSPSPLSFFLAPFGPAAHTTVIFICRLESCTNSLILK